MSHQNIPDIVPENLDLLTFNNYGNIDYTKAAFILCVIQDDIRAYHLGLESAYDWNIDFSASDFNWDDYWMNLMDDLNNYLMENSPSIRTLGKWAKMHFMLLPLNATE